MHRYRVYGVTVESELKLPELHPDRGEAAEVTIRLGRVPDELENASASGVLYQAAPNRFRMALDGVAKFWVRDGSEIVIEKHAKASWDEVRVFLIGSAFGALLHQRGVLPLHAGSVRVDGGCVAFAGRSGMGKSTLTAAFNQAGYPLVSDDILVLTAGENETLAWPAYPQMNVWADSARRLGHSTRRLKPLRGWKQKYALPAQESHLGGPLPLLGLYVLSPSFEERLSMEPLEGGKKLEALIADTYRVQYVEGLGCKHRHFQLCAELGRWIPVRQVRRPTHRFELRRLIKLVEKDWSR